MPQVDLSSALSAMNGNYRQVADIASGEPVQQAQQQQQQLAPENMREMNAGERFFAGLANVGKAMAGGSNFAEYYNENGGLASLLTPEGIGRFALNLPSGMASALPTGFANLYAGATGSNVTYGADVDRGLIDSEQLDLGQRAASLVTG
ncbi:MAG: hypothetical protein IIZ69_04405, partial [Pseudomonas sp.]|nr:hypothetical protein [Pseudomonas sp.]